MCSHPCVVALSATLIGLAFWGGAPAAAVTLVEERRAVAAIHLAEGAPPEVEEAARELALYLQKMCGATVPVRILAPGEHPGAGILLGSLAEREGLHVETTTLSREAYRIRTQGNQVLIVGESAVAVRHGAYHLLEILGVRWFTPGDLGEDVPQRNTVHVPSLDLLAKPDAPYRRFWYGGKVTRGAVEVWNQRNRNAGYRKGSFAHAWRGLVPDRLFDTKPELFSLNQGQRTTRQLCTTNPETVRLASQTLLARMRTSDQWIFPVGPNDGGGLCECHHCQALDTPDYLEPSSGKPNCSDRILAFANQLAEITAKEFPDRLLSFLVYSDYSRIPLKVRTIHPNVIPMVAPIRRCRYHGPDNPICPHNRLLGDEIRGWGGLTRQMGFYPYNYNLADALLPFSKVSAYKEWQRVIRSLNLQTMAWDFETLDAWAIYAPHLYLSARLMWDVDLDIDETMREFYQRFYGPAEAPMRRYWEGIDRAYATTPAHAGSLFDAHLIFTPERMQQWGDSITQAARLATEEPYRTRVAMAAAGFECARFFLRIREATNACRFLEAKAEKDHLFAHLDAMAAHDDPHWTHDRYSKGYFEAFLGRTIESGAAVLQSGGEIVVRLPDVWAFSKDEHDEGIAKGYFRDDFDDGAWPKVKTFSASWEEQGLGLYRGKACWYRTNIEVPERFQGQDLRLWFGGADGIVEVYLNGAKVGGGQGFLQPFEVPVGHALRFGARNPIAVHIVRRGLNELGVGGLLRPVMLYRAVGNG